MASCGQMLHSSQIFLNFPEICYCISAVRTTFRSIQKRHQMNVVDATLFYIIQLLLHALHIACKIVDVEHHAHHVILLVPVRAFLSARIRCTQVGISLHVEAFHIVAQLCKHGAVAIKLHIQPAQLLKVPVKPLPVRRFDCILACFLGCLCLAQCSHLLSCRLILSCHRDCHGRLL